MLTKLKMNLFYEYEHENKIKFFSHNKLKFQPRT